MTSASAVARLLPLVFVGAVSFHAMAQPSQPAAPPPAPHYGTWGVDLAAMDRTVNPGDDFDHYVNGGWTRKTEIPADQASTGVGYDVFNLLAGADSRAHRARRRRRRPLGAMYQQLHERSRGRGSATTSRCRRT